MNYENLLKEYIENVLENKDELEEDHHPDYKAPKGSERAAHLDQAKKLYNKGDKESIKKAAEQREKEEAQYRNKGSKKK